MTDRPRYPRSGCCVPFCRRTSTLFPGEWVCGEHWRCVDRRLKSYRTKRLKALRRRVEAEETRVRALGDPLNNSVDVAARLAVWARLAKARKRWRAAAALIWRRMKRQAIERAGGIA